MTIRTTPLITCAVLALVAAPLASAGAFGRGGPRDDLGPRPASFLRALYPPRLVMRYAADIELTPPQRERIGELLRETQKELVDVQWKLGEASTDLERLLEADRIDERAAMAEAKKVMAIEEEVKERHLRMLIRIRNVLTPAQRAKLATLRRKGPMAFGPPRGGGGEDGLPRGGEDGPAPGGGEDGPE